MLISWFQKHPSIIARHLCCSYFPSQPPTLFRHFKLKTLACFSTHKRNPATKSSNFETLTPVQKQQISLYVETLLQWNQRMNLTAVRDVDEVMSRHVADSLAILPPINNSYCDAASSDGLRLVDVGSGAGLPGLILAIACPGQPMLGVIAIFRLEDYAARVNAKRCRFLEHAVDLVGLTNVQIICGRAESVGQTLDLRETFDVAVARAVAEMRVLAEYCLPLVRIGGLFVAAKGYDPQEEMKNAEKAIQSMGASMLQLYRVESFGPYGQRTAAVYLKDRPTPKIYPRLPGLPSKIPL